MRDGKAIETATVGREGVVGAMSGLGPHVSQVRAIIQLPMFVSKIASTEMRKAVAASKPIADVCLLYNEVLLTQARITAACNALHQVEESAIATESTESSCAPMRAASVALPASDTLR